MERDGEGEGAGGSGRGRWRQREGVDRKDRSCEVWRNFMLLQSNCRLRHRGMD